MNDEAHLLPEKLDKEKPPVLPASHVHSFSKNRLSETPFVRFVQKIGQIFGRSNSQKSELKLSGRILELQARADQVFSELVVFKKEIKEKIDGELFSLVVVFLDPLMKETGRAIPHAGNDENAVHQVKLFSRYIESIEKANDWVQIGRDAGNREELERAIIRQVAKEFLQKIDRDIQVIQDYLSCALSGVRKSEKIKNELSESLMPNLTFKFRALGELKLLPEDFSLQSFMQWRIFSDEKRERYFSEALHLIDRFAEEFLDSGNRRTNLSPQSDEVAETDF